MSLFLVDPGSGVQPETIGSHTGITGPFTVKKSMELLDIFQDKEGAGIIEAPDALEAQQMIGCPVKGCLYNKER